MKLNDLNPQSEKFEPGRTVWVLLHEDQTHIYPNPDGGPAWSYDKAQMDLIKKIMVKDLDLHDYHAVELHVAWPLLCNKQGELEEMWRKTIKQIRRAKSLHERVTIYRLFFNRRGQPHPIAYDEELRKLLRIE